MNKNKDILKDRPELKEMPYDVPAGYFDELNVEFIAKTIGSRKGTLKTNNLTSILSQQTLRSRHIRKALPYLAIAASLLVLALVTFGLIQQKPKDKFYTDQIIEQEYEGLNGELNDEEIIEYLIYTGVSTNVIAMVE